MRFERLRREDLHGSFEPGPPPAAAVADDSPTPPLVTFAAEGAPSRALCSAAGEESALESSMPLDRVLSDGATGAGTPSDRDL